MKWKKLSKIERMGCSVARYEKETKRTIEELQKNFPQYDFIDPMLDVNNSVDEVCGYITIALIAFSIIAILISVILFGLNVMQSSKAE